MKKKISYILFAAIIALASCSEDELRKSDFDYAPDPTQVPTGITTGDASSVGIFDANLKGTVTENSDLIDWGIVVYTPDASESEYIVASAKKSELYSFEVTATDLNESTEYRYKAFALNKNGIAYGEQKTFKTKVNPKFEDTYLFGIYDAIDIDVQTGEQEGDTYQVEIKQLGSIYNRITIFNIWAGERTIRATVDFVEKTITTDDKAPIYVDSSYGNCWMRGFQIVGGKIVYLDPSVDVGYAIASYDAKGEVAFEYWAARVSAGHFGFYATYLTKRK